jgi:hypothetical protein
MKRTKRRVSGSQMSVADNRSKINIEICALDLAVWRSRALWMKTRLVSSKENGREELDTRNVNTFSNDFAI